MPETGRSKQKNAQRAGRGRSTETSFSGGTTETSFFGRPAETSISGGFPLTDRGRLLRLLFSVVFNVGMMFLLYRLFDPVFEGNDDVTIVQFVNGSCGSFDPHLVYQNYLMGMVLSGLYQVWPSMPWYSWFQFWALCASFTAITYVLCCRIRRTAGFGLSLLVQSFAAYEFYINLQYTKTAGVLAAAGMLLLWHGLWGAPQGNDGPGRSGEGAAIAVPDGPGMEARPAAPGGSGERAKTAVPGGPGAEAQSAVPSGPGAGARAGGPGRILWGAVFGGFFLCVWSILYRYVQFAACAALTAPIPLLMLLDAGRDNDPSSRDLQDDGRQQVQKGRQSHIGRGRIFFRCLLACAVLGVLLAALVLFDRSMYLRDPAWKNYVEYNDARSELMDYGMTKYEGNEELYAELGISRTAYDLFDTWNSGDTNVFSTEVMQKLVAARQGKKPGLETLKAFLKEVPKGFLKNRIFRCFLAAAGLWLLFGRHDRRAVLALAAEALLFGALYYYLFLKGRYLYNRVDTGLWMSALVVLLWTWKTEHRHLAVNAARAVLICGVMAVCAFVQIPGWKGKLASHCAESRAHRAETRRAMEKIYTDEEDLYVTKLGILSASRFCAPFEPMPQNILSNAATLGGWKVESVPYNAVLQAHGFSDNPYEAIAGNTDRAEEVYLLDNDIDATLAYLREYYNPDAQAVESGEWNGQTLWRIVSK